MSGDSTNSGLFTRSLSAVARVVPASALHRLSALTHRRAEPEMLAVVQSCPASRAVDVGAWYGPWSYWLSRRGAEVEAFEPNPRVADALRRGSSNLVHVHEVALSDRGGRALLHLDTDRVGGEGTGRVVPAEPAHDSAVTDSPLTFSVERRSLDDFGFDDVALIKIDVEGHELDVLRGARTTIERCRPVLVIELEARHAEVAPTFDYLFERGYEARRYLDSEWVSVTGPALAELQDAHLRAQPPQSYLQSVARPSGYPNNVVFAHDQGGWSPWSAPGPS